MQEMFKEKSSSETQINCQKSCEKCARENLLTMPSSGLPIENSKPVSGILAFRKRRSYDERLKLKKSNKLMSRVDVFKRERLKWIKCSEKLSDNQWITSGPLGSRDAVLVFRTSVLNANNPDTDSQIVSSTSTLDSSTSSLDAGAKDDLDHTTINSKAKVLLPLPKNSNNSNSSNKELKKPNTAIPFNRRLGAKSKEPITSPKKRLHDSLSSSENSISSECDDPTEIEDDIVKATKCTSSNNTEIDHQINSKHVSFDDKENISNSKIINTQEMPAAVLKITYKFMNTETRLLKKIFAGHGLNEVEENKNFNILWTGIHMKPDILRNLTPYQRVNHFPRSYELTRKDRLYKNIEKMQHLRGYKHFDIVPQSYVLPLEYRDLASAHNKYRGPWIVKPAASSRGRGIFIVNSPEQIPVEEQLLVSKYIADPLCIDGHKCDLRVYVVVTSFDPLMIYVYEEGLVRLATVKYDRNAENLWNPCMHLCNYSINKYHSDYIKSSDAHDEDVGHKWTLSALLRHLKSQGCDTRQLMANIEDLIVKSVFACAQSIISACRMFVPNGNNCFELYGFDILIDDTLKPWLLEVNLSPSLGIDTPLDARVKASLITDLLTLIGIPAYSPLMRAHYDSKWTRFRNINCRRTNSADHLNSSTGKKSGGVAQVVPLTPEETRIVKNAKLQNSRRGGFVRIFPTDDTMQRYGSFLDSITGIPISTAPTNGQGACAMILPHNYNQLLFNQLYGDGGKQAKNNNFNARMDQYERALETSIPLNLSAKKIAPKCVEEGKRLRKQIRKLIENGNELTQLQSRQAFSHYLECILRRLTQEPRSCHEKLILKFINRISGTFKAPSFLRNPVNHHIISKDRSAMVAKLLGDYLETYNRDTEAYVDSFDSYGMIPSSLFNDFLSQAQEADLESILTLHTNVTHCMPFLYNRCGPMVPATPPIPTGAYGFLKALPGMILGGHNRDQTKIDSFYKNVDIKETTPIMNREKTEKKTEKLGSSALDKATILKKKSQSAKR